MINLLKTQFIFTCVIATSFSALFAGEIEFKKAASNLDMPAADDLSRLPSDTQTTIANYTEPLEYEWSRTLNTPADQVAFRDDGQNLVSVFAPPYWIWSPTLRKDLKSSAYTDTATLTVRSMKNGAIIEEFPVGREGVLSRDGSRFVARQGVWNTHTGEFIRAYWPLPDVSGTNNDGSLVAINNIPIRGSDREIEIVSIKSNSHYENRPIPLKSSNAEHEQVFFLPDTDERCITKTKDKDDTVFKVWDIATGRMIDTLKFSAEEMDIPRNVQAGSNTAAYDNYSPDKKKLGMLLFPNSWLKSPDSIRLQRLATERIVNFPTPEKVELSEDGSLLVTHTYAPELNSRSYYKTMYIDRIVENGRVWNQEIKGDYTSFALSPDNKLLALATKQNIQLWKQSTVLDALNKKQKIEELRSQKARQVSNMSSSSSAVSSSSSSPAASPSQAAASANLSSAYGLAGIARYTLARDRGNVARTLGSSTKDIIKKQ